MGSNIVAASEIFTGDVGKGDIPVDLARRVETAQGFGRIFPEHKRPARTVSAPRHSRRHVGRQPACT